MKVVVEDVCEIIEYEDIYQPEVKALNYSWLNKYDLWEPIDDEYLDYPRETAIDSGGFILLARANEKIIGTVFFVPIKDGKMGEVCKLCVSEELQGKGIGNMLLQRTIDRVKKNGFEHLILYSNHKLIKALRLYQKFGFEFIEDNTNHYETSDIKMALKL